MTLPYVNVSTRHGRTPAAPDVRARQVLDISY